MRARGEQQRMCRLQDKIPPGSWQLFEQLGALALLPLWALTEYFELYAVTVIGLILAVLIVAGHFALWCCPWCGRLLPTEPFWRTLSVCPYCGEHL